MKTKFKFKLLFPCAIFSLCLLNCAVSDEVRYASSNLVEKQEKTLEAHKKFHNTLMNTLNTFLGYEEARSKKVYEDAVKNYEKGLLQELEKIYADNTKTSSQQKVAEEALRIEIAKYIQEAKDNKEFADSRIAAARANLQQASATILEAENAKSTVIGEIDSYLQAKRFSEKILDYANINLAGFTQKIDNVLGPLENTLANIQAVTNQK